MWTTFAAFVGGAAAGLTGLIFIVVAFRFDIIATSEEYRSRAAQTLTLFVTTIIASALVVAPLQTRTLGLTLLATAIGAGLALLRFDRSARRTQSRSPSLSAMVGLLTVVASTALAGTLLLAGRDVGLYLYGAAALVCLVEGITGGWTFLTRAGREDNASAPTSTTLT